MKKIILILLSIFIINNTNASPFYVGIDYFKSDTNIAGQIVKPTQSAIRLGYEAWPQIAFELQYNQSESPDTLLRFDVDLKESKAFFTRLISLEHDEMTMDVTIGYASTVLSVNGPTGTYNGTNTYEGFAWGIAANQKLRESPNVSYRIAYQSLYDDGDLHIRGISIGMTYRF